MPGEILSLQRLEGVYSHGFCERHLLDKQVAELEALRQLVARCGDELLDYNPVLSLMAKSLQEAIGLEVSARRSLGELAETPRAAT